MKTELTNDDFTKYSKLRKDVIDSKSEQIIENIVISNLQKGYDLLEKAKKSGNEELYKKFKKEYDDLTFQIHKSIDGDKIITKEELEKIRLELNDIVNLYGNTNKENIRNLNYGDIISHSILEKKTPGIEQKNIGELNITEVYEALFLINKNYGTYKEATTIDKIFGKADNISGIRNKYEARLLQEKLIGKLIGTKFENGFGNGYIVGFDSKQGNYVIKANEWKSKFFNHGAKDINSRLLGNYIVYLNQINGGIKASIILENLGSETIKGINEIWNKDNDPKIPTLGKKLLESKGLGNIPKKLSDIANSLNSLDKFIDKIDSTEDEEELDLIKVYLNEKLDQLKIQFKKELKDNIEKNFKNKTNEEKDKIVDEIISIFGKIKNKSELKKIIATIKIVKKKYGLNKLSTDFITENQVNQGKKEAEIDLTGNKLLKIKTEKELEKVKKLKDNKKIESLSKKVESLNKKYIESKINLINAEKNLEITRKLKDKIGVLDNIVNGKTSLEKEIKLIREKDKDFDGKITKLEKQEIKYREQKNKSNTIDFPPNNSTILKDTILKNGTHTIEFTSNNGEKSTISGLTNEEVKSAKESPEVLENIYNFKETLEKLGLSNLWNYRYRIINGINLKYKMIGFNLGKNLLGGKELRFFLISILKSIKQEINLNDSNFDNMYFNEVLNLIKKIQLGKEKTKKGSYIEDFFQKKYINNYGEFKLDDFSKNI